MRIVCPYCPASDDGPATIEIAEINETVVCPRCLRRYTTATRKLVAIDSRRIANGRYAYLLTTEEPGGGRRLRHLEAQEGLRLIAGTEITMVWRGSRLAGISDQSSGTWFAINPNIGAHPHPRLERFLRLCGWLVVALVAVQLVRFVPAVANSVGKAPLLAALVVAALLIVIFLPTLLWTAQTYFGPEGPRRKRILPELNTDLDDDVPAPAPTQPPIQAEPAPSAPPSSDGAEQWPPRF